MISLKIALRSLLKNKTFSIITIGSFGVSIAILILLTSFIISEFSYDEHISDIDRIFRIQNDEDALVPEQARELLINQVPEIESVTNYHIRKEPIVYEGENFRAKIINSDESLFSIFPIEFMVGSPREIFKIKNHAVITESLAKRVFGESNPIGKILNVAHKEDLIVVAIIKDFPSKSTFNGELICSTELKIDYSSSCYENQCTYYAFTLAKLKTPNPTTELNHKISQIIHAEIDDKRGNHEYSLGSYSNIYFDTSNRDGLEHANDQLLKLLAWLALVLLLLSIFNYVNLSISNSMDRHNEFGVKKTLGAGKVNIRVQFILESILCISLATLFAIAIAHALYPSFKELLGKEYSVLEVFSSSKIGLMTIVILISIGSISAQIPARMANKVQAIDLINKKVIFKSGVFGLRRLLNIVQFVFTIIILISLFTINRQINFVKAIGFGFNTEQLIRFPVHYKAIDKAQILKNAMEEIPGVRSACTSMGVPGSIYSMSSNQEVGEIEQISSDHSFLETFEIKVISGRNMREGEQGRVCLINETAFQKTGWDTFEGKKLFGSHVVGIVEDFHFKDLHHSIGPLMIQNDPDLTHLTVRIGTQNISQTIDQIQAVYKKLLPDYEFSYRFYDEIVGSMYKQEEERAKSIKLMAIITIFISCIGLIGLVEFTTRKKIKEIGIRKVNGAKVIEILTLLNKDFVKWVVIAFVIATPIAWFAMSRWLENFAYKTDLSWWVFALAGLLALGIALLTVSWQSWKAATRNPVEALRYE